MDLFTYLMAKNGNNTSVHGDLFSYLLGKAQGGGGEIKTATGITINIPDAKKLVSFMMTKESTQDGEPSPDNPVEVKTVKGYRNLLNLNSTKLYLRATSTLVDDDTIRCRSTLTTTNGATMFTIPVEVGESITISYENVTFSGGSINLRYKEYDEAPSSIESISQGTAISLDNKYVTITTTKPYLTVLIRTGNGGTTIVNGLMVAYSSEKLPYGRYGNNYVAVKVSDGTNTNNYPIPLNNNEIVGIGDYKDELLVDKTGHVYLNKKIWKDIFNGSQTITRQTSSLAPLGYYYQISISKIALYSTYTEVPNRTMCSNFKVVRNATADLNNGCITMGTSGTKTAIGYKGTTADLKTYFENNPTNLYYELATPETIDLQTTVDLKLFKGVNNVSNSEDGYMTIEYK